ncbi:MAG: glycolate oxidase subunit GlcE [Rhizobiales bacterium]|nr:glycolate oxidase subunit GlcE [Hyphomicrobiales bacterium]
MSEEQAILTPGDEAELAAIIADAAAARRPLAVEGGGALRGLGRPLQAAATLSTRRLTGVTLYEPTELVVSARAGTPLAEVENLLAGERQRLAFEPPDWRALYGSDGVPTVGGVAAANLSGPRRITAGAARDSLIGLRFVDGRGEVVKNGGRVMKNVTGYDLVKFLAGSYGTLAVMSEVTFKVQPMPEVEATLVLQGLDDRRAIAALAAGLGSPYGVTGAAHVPAQNGTPARTLLRLDGFTASVDYRLGRLAEDLVDFGSAARIEAAPSAALWKSIRDLSVFASPAGVPVWRVSVRPGDGPSVAEAARKSFACRVLYDWGGGLVWIAGGDGPDAGASVIRPAARAAGGYATLARAPEPLRAANDVFDPPASALMALTRRLKDTFDPAGILNPGRMYAGV